MITVERIVLENYGSYHGKHELSMRDRGLCFIAGQNLDEPRMNANGAGKSTLFDALDWGLFGVVPRKDTADSVINQRAGGECSVTVHLLDDTTPIEVHRFRGRKGKEKKGLWFKVGEHVIQALDDDHTQKRLEQYLGLDRDIFHASVLFAQTDVVGFADAKDARRMEILTKLLQLEALDEYQERAKQLLKTQQGKAQELEIQLRTIESQLSTRAPEEEFDRHAAEWQAQQAAQIDAIAKRQTELSKITHDASSSRVQIETIDRQIMEMVEPQDPTPDLQLAIRQREDYVRTWMNEGHTYRAKIADIQKRIQQFQKLGKGQCPECLQLVDAEHVENHIGQWEWEAEDYQGKVAKLEQDIAQQQKEAEEIKAKVRQLLDAHQAQVQAFRQNVYLLQQDRARHNAVIEAATRAYRELEELGNQRGALEQQTNPWLERKQEYVAERARLAGEMGKVQAELDYIKREGLYRAQFWVDGFGRGGLRNYIMDARLEEMNQQVNEWVHLLTGGTCWIRFETQKQNQNKTLSNKFNVRVFRWETNGTTTERNYVSWSGGEKRRVALGIDLGLNALIARRASKRWDLLILDEAFKHLDARGREAVVDMLNGFRGEKSSIFVVDHDAEFAGHFENQITVIKQDGVSRIEDPEGVTDVVQQPQTLTA